jgi:AbrB family looped-hinge helix DNA binding protein
MLSVKVSTKHQIVVPSEARAALGIEPGDRLDVLVQDGLIVLRPRPRRPSDRLRGLWVGKPWATGDAVAYVRSLRDEVDARMAEREELVGHAARRPSTRRAR